MMNSTQAKKKKKYELNAIEYEIVDVRQRTE